MNTDDVIRILNASENNLNSVTLDIPKNKFVVVTGVSGSGKSSLVFDVLYREAEFRYFGSFPAYARMFLGKIKRPEVERIEGLSPAVAVDQGSVTANPRSTVGTLSGIHDDLRLLFARTGEIDGETKFKLSRSLFSFNSPDGACDGCKGLGVEDRIDPALLVGDESKSIRQRCMTITTPNGYIMYSQVTLDVLDQVCRSEGFNIDIPWKNLSPENKQVIFYGSGRIKIPFGKHPLESRMKWSGITAKPREMGVYKGIIPVMEEILKRERNKNILRFVRTTTCRTCGGRRLNPKALSVKTGGWNIASLSALPVTELTIILNDMEFPAGQKKIASGIIQHIRFLSGVMDQLGLGHLTADRESGSLSAGESRRLKLATQLGPGLSGMIYVFDEPSVGLHAPETLSLISVLKQLRDQGNTVIVVEHDEEFIRHADHLIDIGPGPGIYGGNVLLNCSVNGLVSLPGEIIKQSKTLSYFLGKEVIPPPARYREGGGELRVNGARHNNLKNIDVTFLLGTLNVVTGVSGAGKSSLVHQVLGRSLRAKLNRGNDEPGKHASIEGGEGIRRLAEIDQSPIGKTPRSNPATYTGLFDHIRDLYAALPESVAKGYGKSRFSFNIKGGRCEECQGAGYKQSGMHFMGIVEILCETCNGKRFDEETLEIRWKGKNIYEVLEMPVSQALVFFTIEKKILRFLQTLDELGLGYLKLGQRSSTLSGGEAQRVKLAAQLADPSASHTLYILDEPTTGLHSDDVKKLLSCLNGLADHGHTLICIEHHPAMLQSADRVILLGPGSGEQGGNIVFAGTPEDYFSDAPSLMPHGSSLMAHGSSLITHHSSLMAHDSSLITHDSSLMAHGSLLLAPVKNLQMRSVTTNNLKSINVTIPHGRHTVITGVSGSGKSSLAFDTIYAEARNRFLANFSTYARSRIGMKDKPGFEEMSGLRPAFAVGQSGVHSNPRSTVGTYTGIHDLYRLLFSRAGVKDSDEAERPHFNEFPVDGVPDSLPGPSGPGETRGSASARDLDSIPGWPGPGETRRPLSTLFSFNGIQGACPRCDGLGVMTLCNPSKLVTHPGKSILAGAMDGTKTGRFYGDPYGQYVATLKAAGSKHGMDFSLSWNELPQDGKDLALNGCEEEVYDINWEFLRKARSGTHHFKDSWPGLLQLVNSEYARKHADHRGEGMRDVMDSMECPDCHGSRLNPVALSWSFGGKNIAGVSEMSISGSIVFFSSHPDTPVSGPLVREILRRLRMLDALGLSYLTLSRSTGSLSHGEARRLQLAAQTGSGLSGMIYVLDEPSAGLHSKDIARLVDHIRELVQSGNTVITVEHEKDVILGADYVIDMGPGAGDSGGEIIAEGTPVEIMKSQGSVTGKYLLEMPGPQRNSIRMLKPGLSIKNAFIHNLRNFDLEIPSGGITCVTGVSGSGKSSLVFDLIHASWKAGKTVGCEDISGFGNFSRLVSIEFREEYSSPLAVVATYSGAFDLIRGLFAAAAGSGEGRPGRNYFSFLNKQGQCPDCEGLGENRISMDFMPDVYRECETCLGKRYRPEILSVKFAGKDISEVLEFSVSEAKQFFSENKTLHSIFTKLELAGLGYLKLGQALSTLSGGEAQRLSLSKEMMKPAGSNNLYLFEEPSNGLHFSDIENLVRIFHGLAEQGNTLIVIEHDRQIIREADFIIELGPEGGERGGYLLNRSVSFNKAFSF
jgi:excinuclease ABC subunit A